MADLGVVAVADVIGYRARAVHMWVFLAQYLESFRPSGRSFFSVAHAAMGAFGWWSFGIRRPTLGLWVQF